MGLLDRLRKPKLPSPVPVPQEGPASWDPIIAALCALPVLDNPDLTLFANPSPEVQSRFVGGSFNDAYTEAASFLDFALGNSIGFKDPERSKVLDFGCGWGRMLRLLRMRTNLDHLRLSGCDPLEEALDICRRSIPRVSLVESSLFPPSDFRSACFDLVYAYSVFSHLSPECHLAWAQEFSRIIKPEGWVVITTQSKRLLAACRSYAAQDSESLSRHHKKLAGSFTEEDCEARYDAGEFLYSATGEGLLAAHAYGEAVVPRAFFEKWWPRFGFQLVVWEDREDILGGQSRVILQKLP